jgi:hypothetical protein
MKEIIDRILKQTTVDLHSIHGRCHWDRVADYRREQPASTGGDSSLRFRLIAHC